jgi:hypothetical protein
MSKAFIKSNRSQQNSGRGEVFLVVSRIFCMITQEFSGIFPFLGFFVDIVSGYLEANIVAL